MRWPFGSAAQTAAIEAAVAKAVEPFKGEIARLEGLLDVVGPDIDGAQHSTLFRDLRVATKGASRDLDRNHRERILRLAHLNYALRGAGENLIDTHLDFLLGDALRPLVKDKKATELQTELDEIWTDPRNKLDREHEDYTRALLVEGELVMTADLEDLDGHLELGWMDPLRIQSVTQDRRGRDAFLMVSRAHHEPEPWFVLSSLTEEIQIAKSESGVGYTITEGGLSKPAAGLAFFGAWNRVKGATRGRSELMSVIDQIDAQDEMLWSAVEVQNLRRWFLLHIKDPSIRTGAQARLKLEELKLKTPPRNPKVLATNDDVSIELVTHEGVATESKEQWLAKELGVSIMGAKGMPEGWRGSQSEKGLAGARAGDLVPLRRLRRKQRRLGEFWHTILAVSLELRRRAKATNAEGDFVMQALEVGGKDKQRGAEVMRAVSTALTQAAGAGGVKPELVNAVIVQLVKDLGIELTEVALGVPEEAARPADEVDAELRELASQRSRLDDEGNLDEGDRDRRRTA